MTRASIYCVFVVATCLGCGGGAVSTVQGTVTIDGQLAPRGTVLFHPVDDGPTAYGAIDDKGTYSMRVGQGDLSDPDAGEVPAGEYIVTAVVNMPSTKDDEFGQAGPPRPGARLTAEKYAQKETSDLHVTVKPGRNILPLELEGASAETDEATSEAATSEPPAEPGGDPINEKGAGPPSQSDQPKQPTSGESETEQRPEATSPSESSEPAASVEEPQ
jgi:hypothetical protein